MGNDLRAIYVMRRDLNMSSGKMAVQVGHLTTDMVMSIADTCEFAEWYTECAQKKITKGIKTMAKLQNLMKTLLDEGIEFATMHDNGLTEFNGVRTFTGIVIFPTYKELPTKVHKLQLWKD